MKELQDLYLERFDPMSFFDSPECKEVMGFILFTSSTMLCKHKSQCFASQVFDNYTRSVLGRAFEDYSKLAGAAQLEHLPFASPQRPLFNKRTEAGGYTFLDISWDDCPAVKMVCTQQKHSDQSVELGSIQMEYNDYKASICVADGVIRGDVAFDRVKTRGDPKGKWTGAVEEMQLQPSMDCVSFGSGKKRVTFSTKPQSATLFPCLRFPPKYFNLTRQECMVPAASNSYFKVRSFYSILEDILNADTGCRNLSEVHVDMSYPEGLYFNSNRPETQTSSILNFPTSNPAVSHYELKIRGKEMYSIQGAGIALFYGHGPRTFGYKFGLYVEYRGKIQQADESKLSVSVFRCVSKATAETKAVTKVIHKVDESFRESGPQLFLTLGIRVANESHVTVYAGTQCLLEFELPEMPDDKRQFYKRQPLSLQEFIAIPKGNRLRRHNQQMTLLKINYAPVADCFLRGIPFDASDNDGEGTPIANGIDYTKEESTRPLHQHRQGRRRFLRATTLRFELDDDEDTAESDEERPAAAAIASESDDDSSSSLDISFYPRTKQTSRSSGGRAPRRDALQVQKDRELQRQEDRKQRLIRESFIVVTITVMDTQLDVPCKPGDTIWRALKRYLVYIKKMQPTAEKRRKIWPLKFLLKARLTDFDGVAIEPDGLTIDKMTKLADLPDVWFIHKTLFVFARDLKKGEKAWAKASISGTITTEIFAVRVVKSGRASNGGPRALVVRCKETKNRYNALPCDLLPRHYY